MSTKNQSRQDNGGSRTDLNSHKTNNKHKNLVALTADFYTEWSIEKSSVEKPKSKKSGNTAESASGNTVQTTNYDQYY
jgi:hypothetical protein